MRYGHPGRERREAERHGVTGSEGTNVAGEARSGVPSDATSDAASNAAVINAPVIYVCITCRRAGEPDSDPRPGAVLAAATATAALGTGIAVREVRCLANCSRGPSAAIRANGSWTYVFGALEINCAGALVEGARLLAAAADGLLPWRGRPEPLKRGLIARVPPLGFVEEDLDQRQHTLTRHPRESGDPVTTAPEVKPVRQRFTGSSAPAFAGGKLFADDDDRESRSTAVELPAKLPGGRRMSATLARVPCTIVTGFLGAGKTTLIRHVLANVAGRRLAVIVNEFGDVGIDGELLRGCGDAACPEENIVELANGCLCCTVADEFVPALDTILSRTPAVEHIVIETSGLALPKPLVQAFHWPAIRSRVTVDGVVAVVDGAALAEGRVAADLAALAGQRAADPSLDHDDPVEEVFEDQIACADLVVLNKRDLLDAAGADRAAGRIAAALPRAVKVVAVSGGRVDPAALLGLGVGTEEDIENRRTRHDAEPEHDHDDFDSFVVPLPDIGDPAALAARVRAAAEAHDVLRVKGFAAVAGKPMRLLVQAVGPRVTHQYDRPWNGGEPRAGRLVVIGLKGIDRAAVARMLRG
jgi:cobalamin biosynthesis protein CobW